MLSNYLGDRPFWKDTLRLSVPVIIQNLLTSSFALVDTLMVGNLGDVALSATGMASQWSFFLGMIIIGLGSGMSVFAAQYWGVRDLKGIRRVGGITTLCGVLVTLIFMLPSLFFPRFVIGLFNQDAAILQTGSHYLSIACLSYPATMLTMVFSHLLRSTEKVKIPMYASAAGTAGNIILNYVLIFGKLGFPAMGVTGAAIATCISAWMSPVIIVLISVRQRNILCAPLREFLRFNGAQVKEFFSKAMPAIVNNALWGGGTLIVNLIYSNMGYEYYAAVTILRTFGDLGFAAYLGFGISSTILVGKAVGCGEIASARRNATRYTTLVILASFVVGGLIAVFRRPLIGIFNFSGNITDLTLATAMAIFLFYGLEQPLRNVAYVHIDGVFRAGGDTITGAIFDVGALWLFAIPTALLASRVLHLPFAAVFALTYLAEDIPKDIGCMIHFISGKWIRPVTAEGRAGLEAYNREGKKK